MSKKIRILIVEDDKKFADSLLRILSEEGYQCMLAEKPQTAISLAKIHSFDLAIIDCMLPQMNGIDLSLRLKENNGDSMVIFLMSGIYKDKNFSTTALKKTGAEAFLLKPFEIPELIMQIQSTFKNVDTDAQASLKTIKGLIGQENLSQNIIYTIINSNPIINGNELPFIINSLMAYKCQGVLNIHTEKSSIELQFNESRISANEPQVSSTKLREVILSRGWAIPEDIDLISPDELTLPRLQELCQISPHFAANVAKEQISQFITEISSNQNINIKYEQGLHPEKPILFEAKEVDNILYSCTVDTDINWLKAFYLPLMSHRMNKMSMTQNKTQNFPLLSAHKNAIALMTRNQTITDYFAECGIEEHISFRLIHILFVFREFFLSSTATAINYKSHLHRLKNLHAGLDSQNAFERLGLTDKATELDVKKSYLELSQSLHPDKLVGAPEEVKTLSLIVYEKIQEAYNQIKTPEKRELYLKKLESLRREQIQKADLILDKAENALSRGEFVEAERFVIECEKLAPYYPRLKLISCWSLLKSKKAPAAQIARNLQSLTAEEKETALYAYVKGLMHHSAQELDKAITFYKSALAKNPELIPARRDLMTLTKEEKKEPVNILTSDLKSVVGLFFNKKK